jgi:hypothetical protein
VAADRAEAPRVEERQVVGAEAAHGYASDGETTRVRVGRADHERDRLVDHVVAPVSACAVVPVAVVVAVGKGDDRRRRAKPGQRLEHRLVLGVGAVRAATPVEEDQQGAMRAGSGRNHHVDVEVLADRTAVDGQVLDAGAVCVGGREDRRLEEQVRERGGTGEQDRECGAPPAPHLPA